MPPRHAPESTEVTPESAKRRSSQPAPTRSSATILPGRSSPTARSQHERCGRRSPSAPHPGLSDRPGWGAARSVRRWPRPTRQNCWTTRSWLPSPGDVIDQKELVARLLTCRAREQDVSLTGQGGLLSQFTKNVLQIADGSGSDRACPSQSSPAESKFGPGKCRDNEGLEPYVVAPVRDTWCNLTPFPTLGGSTGASRPGAATALRAEGAPNSSISARSCS